MKIVLNICLFLSCFIISTMARPQSIWDNIFVPNAEQQQDPQQQDPQQDNPFLPQSPVNRPSNPFFPTISSTAAPTEATSTSTARTPTTASPQYLACMARCPTTMEYNPVCGSDSINYHNNGRLECAKFCGKSVVSTRAGTCSAL